MDIILPVEIYEAFEVTFGKERAKEVIKALERAISERINYRWATTKEELLDAIRKEFITRDIFEERMNSLKAELIGTKDIFEERTNSLKAELIGKIEVLYEKTEKDKLELKEKIGMLNQKLNFLILLVIIALTLMNPVVAEILKSLLKLG